MNRSYPTRNSGRYNTPGQFVPAGELSGNSNNGRQGRNSVPSGIGNFASMYSSSNNTTIQPTQGYQNQQKMTPPPAPPILQEVDDDVKMEPPMDDTSADDTQQDKIRPHWMKNKLQGVKKISNKERRRRQNETLRRLITPKNALMVLNEMMPGEQFTNQFKVEVATPTAIYNNTHNTNFCADLTVEGQTYKGYGDNKMMARNAAAEQAIRDLIIKKMTKFTDTSSLMSNESNGELEEDALPMIQLASFALHKLFSEWEFEGHKVPQLKPQPGAAAAAQGPVEVTIPVKPAAKKPKEIPENAADIHPCMLLTYMRPRLEYVEMGAEGDKPQNMVFTMGIEVDGVTYIGKASNKKEARKAAAKSACQALFHVQYNN